MTSFGNHTPAAAPATAPQRSRYGGIQCPQNRDDMISEGEYRARVVSMVPGKSPKTYKEYTKVTVHIESAAEGSATPADTDAIMLFFVTPAGLTELRKLAVHAAGYGPTLAQINAGSTGDLFAEGWQALEDLEAKRSGYSGAILDATEGQKNGSPSLVGRLVDIRVARGKSTPSGDYFRNLTFGSVPDNEHQTA